MFCFYFYCSFLLTFPNTAPVVGTFLILCFFPYKTTYHLKNTISSSLDHLSCHSLSFPSTSLTALSPKQSRPPLQSMLIQMHLKGVYPFPFFIHQEKIWPAPLIRPPISIIIVSLDNLSLHPFHIVLQMQEPVLKPELHTWSLQCLV